MLRLPAFQFLLVLPTLAAVAVVALSAAVGLDHPSANFGAVFTWVVWWGALLVSFVILGRVWCLVCPLGVIGEWAQRLSLWWRSSAGAGLDLPWPRRLRNLWLATALFVAFVFLDNAYGMSNSPRMTAGLVVVLVLGAAWVNFFFERRAFCRYVCPLTAFIGLNALVSGFELRSRDPGVCRTRCATKDCFRGNARRWGCPMGEFPGAMDTNLYCILCTECVKSCPHDNIALRFRTPGRDLWAMRKPRMDGAVAAVLVVGLATTVPLLMVTALPQLRSALATRLPLGAAPNDPPRLAAAAMLFVLGTGAALGLVWIFSALSRRGAGDGPVTTRALFTRTAYAIVPVGLSRLMADLLDHASRTGGAVADVTRAMLLDFPLNRVVPDRITVFHLLGPTSVYALQVGLLLGGLLLSLSAMRRIARALFLEGEASLAALLPMAGLALVLTLVSVWTLGLALL